MNPRGRSRRLIEQRQRPRKVQIGILRNERGHAFNRPVRQNRARLRQLHLRRILWIRQKRQLAETGLLQPGNTRNFRILAEKLTPQPRRNFN
jgi:hypothetical protein